MSGIEPSQPSIQDRYPKLFAHCYGCGPLNPDGHHLRSWLVGEESTAIFQPSPKYTGGFPEFAYGGLLASLLDCHGAATAAAFAARHDRGSATDPMPRFVTASLKVDYKRPAPLKDPWALSGKLRSIDGKKVWVDLTLSAGGQVCVTGEMLAIRIPDDAQAKSAT